MAVSPESIARKLVSLPRELAKAIESYRLENRIKTEPEAIRRSIERGLAAETKTERSEW